MADKGWYQWCFWSSRLQGEKTGAEVKENDVKGKENQEIGKKIMVQNKEMENQEKEKEEKKFWEE